LEDGKYVGEYEEVLESIASRGRGFSEDFYVAQ
jgi:hypothetical protein